MVKNLIFLPKQPYCAFKKIHSKNNKNIKLQVIFNRKDTSKLVIKNKNFEKGDKKVLHLFQEISKIIQESKIIFTSEIKGITKVCFGNCLSL